MAAPSPSKGMAHMYLATTILGCMALSVSASDLSIGVIRPMGSKHGETSYVRAVDSVHASCEMDVALFCTKPAIEDPFYSFVIAPLLSDSFFVLPPPPPPKLIKLEETSKPKPNVVKVEEKTNSDVFEFDPIGSALDNMIDMTLELISPFVENEDAKPNALTEELDAVDKFFDEMLSSFFGALAPPSGGSDSASKKKEGKDIEDETEKKTPRSSNFLGEDGHGIWKFEEVSNAVTAHGKKLLDESDDSQPEKRRLARRLTELHPPPVPSSMRVPPPKATPHLGYGCEIDHCLWHRHEMESLSIQCSAALEAARASYIAMQHHNQLHANNHKLLAQTNDEEPQDEFTEGTERLAELNMALAGVVLAFSIILLLRAAIFKRRMRMFLTPEKRRLKRKIMNAVYNDPELKEKVQQAIGEEDMGNEPPLPPRCRDVDGEEGCTLTRCMDKICMSLPLISLSVLLFFTSLNSPEVVLFVGGPAIILMTLYMLLKSCCGFFYRESNENGFELQAREPLLGESPLCSCGRCDGNGMIVITGNGDTMHVCCCCGGSGKVQNVDGSTVDCASCCAHNTHDSGNDTGACYNCDAATLSCCGDCGCCVNCCNCNPAGASAVTAVQI